MLISPDHRISLADRSPVPVTPELEAVFIGAAAATVDADAAADAIAAAVQLGFPVEAADTTLTSLPLCFTSAASFAASFPDDTSWLALAVRDYFDAGGLRAWVVRVVPDPAAPTDAYFRRAGFSLAAQTPSGIDVAMQVPSAGLLLLPDLEGLCVATAVAAAPALPSAPSPIPGFRPISEFSVATAAPAPASPAAAVAVTPNQVLTRANAALAGTRPDMLCLFALPVGADESLSTATLLQRASSYLYGTATGPDLPQVQSFAPLARGADGALVSPSGLVAGTLAASAQTDGVWRSIAGKALPLGYTPLRRIESAALDRMRRAGISSLRYDSGSLVLDDDILAVKAAPGSAARGSAGTRRLMGWLLRNLRRFGEQLVFENVLDGGLVEMVLLDLFTTLQQRGALNGRQVADAVRITPGRTGDTGIQFDIAIDTAYALETIQLRFQDGGLSTSLGAAA
ncbi:hypothetical protein [Rhodopila sp.]|uniref:hypothetical protein n=1 Tax=Rhodopila sp. TaxID=2480087 RepID=UPI002BCC39F1|nr:hypothetical protein [Rhodopila sp.]HVZ08871.1 hypothetical protein [Rhodopila sp.]